RGLDELPAACYRRYEADGREKTVRYWTPEFKPNKNMTFEEAVAGVRERLIRSMELRLRADVPLAFCMSGGIDSNALIGIAKRVFHYDVEGFTVVNRDKRYEEQDMVNCAVKTLGLRHTSIPVDTTDFLQKMRVLVRQHDAPVFTITFYAQWRLMEQI